MSSNELSKCEVGSSSNLLKLPPEILTMLLLYCPIESKVALRATCRRLRLHIEIPDECRTVDISVHTPWSQISDGEREWPAEFELRPLALKQHKFIQDVIKTPTIGRLVHDLT